MAVEPQRRDWTPLTVLGVAGSVALAGAGFQFRLASAIGSRWTYRISRAPSCRGSLVVTADPAGGTLYQATADS